MAMNKTKRFLALILISVIFHTIQSVSSIKFNRNCTGVVLSVYVKSVEPHQNRFLGWDNYTFNEIKTMLQVISTRFRKVSTFGVGAKSGTYLENKTYHESYSQVYTAEAAARLNQEKNEQVISVAVGIYLSDYPALTRTEIQLAWEAAHKANKIYPGTVWGLVFSQEDFPISSDFNMAAITLTELRQIKKEAVAHNLKLGTRQSCEKFNDTDKTNVGTDHLKLIRKKIIRMTDFIICTKSIGEENNLLQFREELTKINPNIEVMGQTHEVVADTLKQVTEMKEYWTSVDRWATQNNMTVWYSEAFDNPWKHWNGHTGWWKLSSDKLASNVSGYIEKVESDMIPEEKETLFNSIITENGFTMAGIVIMTVFVVGGIAVLCIRFDKLRPTLNQAEIKEFLYGFSERKRSIADATEESCKAENAALAAPYDGSLEISKKDFKIDWQFPLGAGQFGIVFKAMLRLPREDKREIAVAIKMTKDGCPKNEMMSLLSEIKILTYLGDHKNLVSIMGAYTAEIYRGVVYIATELCELGSLKDYPKSRHSSSSRKYVNIMSVNSSYANTDQLISVEEMVCWSYEIACGMEYLASKHVIHADLAARNVLLNAKKVAKITDFGLSRRLYNYTSYVKKQQAAVPWRWMSIEALKKWEFSQWSDVWSYGVTVWEIFTMGDVPYPGLAWTLDFVTFLEQGLRLKRPRLASEEMFNIMSSCWNTEPSKRPAFSELKLNVIQLAGQHVQWNANVV